MKKRLFAIALGTVTDGPTDLFDALMAESVARKRLEELMERRLDELGWHYCRLDARAAGGCISRERVDELMERRLDELMNRHYFRLDVLAAALERRLEEIQTRRTS